MRRIIFIGIALTCIVNTDIASAYDSNDIQKDVAEFNVLLISERSEAVKLNEGLVQISEEEIAQRKYDKVMSRWRAKQEQKWNDLNYDPFMINASAYTASADECGNSNGITASGIKVAVNRTIACPPAYPFGTTIEINGMGTYICEDRGGAIKGNKFDIYMETKKEAFSFGRRNIMARVIQQ